MNAQTDVHLIAGPAGALDIALDRPAAGVSPIGLAVIAHPHPLFGGTRDNKVVQTIARALMSRGLICLRPNFRGVGQSEGAHSLGIGEQDDLWATWQWAEATLGANAGPSRWMAGFSFGAVMSSHLAANWEAGRAARGLPPQRLGVCLLVGLATERMSPSPPVAMTRMIHGEADDVASLAGALDHARPFKQPVMVLPGAGHFFHGMLPELREMVVQAVADIS